jgi:hypothetical protein
MLLFFLILVAIFSVSTTIVLWMELSVTSNTVDWLEDRLTKLEKDAVKVTFSEPPLFHPKPKTQTDYQNEHVVHPEIKKKSNPKQFDGVKSEEPFVKTRKKRKPKTVGEWEEEIDLGGHE